MKTKLLLVAALATGLGACSTASTEDIGSPVTPVNLTNAPGMISFAVDMNSETGVPESVIYSNSKDDTGSLIETVYPFDPDTGNKTSVKYTYSIENSSGSTQTAAVLAAVESVAKTQAEAGEAITGAALGALVDGLRVGLGVPGG